MFSRTHLSNLRFIRNHNSRRPVPVGLKVKKKQRKRCNEHKRTIGALEPFSLALKTGKNPSAQFFKANQETLGFSGKILTLKVVNDILRRSFEDCSTGQSHLQQIVPTTLQPKILESTATHLGVTKTLEKLRIRFNSPGN